MDGPLKILTTPPPLINYEHSLKTYQPHGLQYEILIHPLLFVMMYFVGELHNLNCVHEPFLRHAEAHELQTPLISTGQKNKKMFITAVILIEVKMIYLRYAVCKDVKNFKDPSV